MTNYSFGDVALVPFPFTDQSAVKKRPAVVVSSDEYNRRCPDIVIMAVTSQMRWADYYGDVVISDWQQAGLLKPSVIKPVFTTLEKAMVNQTAWSDQRQRPDGACRRPPGDPRAVAGLAG